MAMRTHSPEASGALRRFAGRICKAAVVLFAKALTAVHPVWRGIDPEDDRQRIYFANHASHGDFILIWAVLPPDLRRRARPVAGADYWTKGALRRFIGRDVFNALLIERDPAARTQDPVETMARALEGGDSLIIFPEGTRNLSDAPLLPFKSGLFHLARRLPGMEFAPVWIENLNRVLPKGASIPVPLMCSATFGAPLRLSEGEEKADFLERAREALLGLRQKTGSAS